MLVLVKALIIEALPAWRVDTLNSRVLVETSSRLWLLIPKP